MKTVIAFVLGLMIYMALLPSCKPSSPLVALATLSNLTDSLELTVEEIGWQQDTEFISLDDRWYLAVKATLKNVSKDTIEFMNWWGDPSLRFTIDDNNFRIRPKPLTRKNNYEGFPLAPSEAHAYKLYIARQEWNSIHIKCRIGFEWVKQVTRITKIDSVVQCGHDTITFFTYVDDPHNAVPFKTFWSAPIWLF